MSESWDGFLQSRGMTTGGGALQNVLNTATGALQFAGPVGQAASQFISTAQSVAQMFGKGRREADIIVPIQNQVGDLLRVVNEQAHSGSLSREQLIQYQEVVASAYAEFDRFTRDARFTDGRASVQARNTIRPLIDGRGDSGNVVRTDGGTLGTLQRMIDALGGGGYYITTTGGLVSIETTTGGYPTNPSVFVPPSTTAMQRTSGPLAAADSKTLLLAGGALLAAKLLKVF